MVGWNDITEQLLARSPHPDRRAEIEFWSQQFGRGRPARRQRKPSIGRMIAAAERGGKKVTSVTTPDGVTLHFGKVEDTEASNPWLAGIDDKATKQ